MPSLPKFRDVCPVYRRLTFYLTCKAGNGHEVQEEIVDIFTTEMYLWEFIKQQKKDWYLEHHDRWYEYNLLHKRKSKDNRCEKV